MAFIDYYKILGVDRNIPQKDVRAAYLMIQKQRQSFKRLMRLMMSSMIPRNVRSMISMESNGSRQMHSKVIHLGHIAEVEILLKALILTAMEVRVVASQAFSKTSLEVDISVHQALVASNNSIVDRWKQR